MTSYFGQTQFVLKLEGKNKLAFFSLFVLIGVHKYNTNESNGILLYKKMPSIQSRVVEMNEGI